MKYTKDILKSLQTKYRDINYYYIIIDKIEKNVDSNPDIAIESCKALIEGLSKFILKQIDSTYSPEKFIDLQPLFRKSLSAISIYNNLEEDFTVRAGSLVHLLGEIRSKRGDISHGKLAPKEVKSESVFSNFVMQITDSILYYVLICFSMIELKEEINFDDNEEFNEYLDEQNPLEKIRYSKALFELDRIAYEQELIAYNEQ